MSRFFLLSAVSAVSLSFGLSAAAQDAEDRQETVIVTTPGPEREADELIGNATALNREEILENLYSTLGDTLDRQPGVASTFYGQGASRPVLRGLGAERVQVLTNGIGVLDVSAASPDHQVTADGIDAEKIEILRGPAALAYGGQAIGGVVNVIDGLIVEEVPDEPFSADLFGAYNSVNEGTELAGKAKAVSGPFVFSFSASQRDFDNYEITDFAESSFQMEAEEAEGEEHSDEEEASDTLENSFVETGTLSAGVSWIGEKSFFGVALRRQTSEYGLPGGHEHGEEGEGEGEEEEENPFIDLEQLRLDLRGGMTLSESGPFTDVKFTASVVDYEHTEFEAPGEAGTMFDTEGYETRIELGTDISGFEGAVGLLYLDKDFSAVGEEAFVTPTDTQSLSIFTYQTRELDSGMGIEGGLRLESIELDNIILGSRDFALVSASAGVNQSFNNGWFLGTQLSYTQRAPNESELFAFGPHLATNQFEVGDPGLDKETGINVEFAARWSADNAQFGVNLFYTNFEDFTFLTPTNAVIDGEFTDIGDGLPVFGFVQRGADFVGGEIYGSYSLDESPAGADWDFTAGLDFVDAELDTGGNVPFIPPVTLNAGASAEWGAVEVGANLTVAGEQDDPGIGQFPTDGYTQLDLRAELDLSDYGFGADGTEAFVEVRNLTDEEIRYATSVLKDIVPAPARNVRAGVRVAF